MSEYYLEIWGRDADEARRRIGDLGAKTYFATKAARDRALRMIQGSGLLVCNWQATVRDRKHPVAVVVLRHGGKKYTVEDHYFPGYSKAAIRYRWVDGNFSCDCNRSLSIQGVDPSFPDMNCGEQIELVSLRVEHRETTPGDEDRQ